MIKIKNIFPLLGYLITDGDKVSRRTVLIISANFESDQSQLNFKQKYSTVILRRKSSSFL